MGEMWATVAAMSMHVRELNTVEIAFAAIDQVDKVHFIGHITKLPDEVLKSAELALLCRKPDEAVQILLQHLRELDHEENHPEFKQAAEQLGPVDWTQIKAKIEMEKEDERREAGLA